ncbi:thermonuclease family protein [Leucobacter sp. BZR 635]
MKTRSRRRGMTRRGAKPLGLLAMIVGVLVVGAVGLGLAGSDDDAGRAGDPTAPADPSPPASGVEGTSGGSGGGSESDPVEPGEAAVFQSVVDGDTIRTDLGTVRIIGIDTPERGECGYADAAAVIRGLLSEGDRIVLALPSGQNGADRYERLLRYVATSDGVDVGLAQLEAGNAVTRYDSSDGYPKHPREAEYRAAQGAELDFSGSVITTRCAGGGGSAAGSVPGSAPGAVPGQPSEGESADWWTQYPSCAALERNTVGHPTGPFNVADPEQAAIYEWFANGTGFRGDGDGDGLACE